MELDDLKNIWEKQEAKLDQVWKLNAQLLKEANLDKAKSSIDKLRRITALTLAFYLTMTFIFLSFAILNWGTWYFVLSGSTLAIWAGILSVGSIQQLDLISKIDYSQAVSVLQLQLSKLKLVILRYVRIAQWILPFNLAFIIFTFKVLLGFDIIKHADPTWLLIQIIFSMCLLPLSYWFHRKLSPKNIDKKWVSSLLQGYGSRVNEALEFISRVEQFREHR